MRQLLSEQVSKLDKKISELQLDALYVNLLKDTSNRYQHFKQVTTDTV